MTWSPILSKMIEVKKEYFKNNNDRVNFEDMLKTIEDRELKKIFEPLQINQHKNLVLVRYGLHEMCSGLWDDPNSIYRECRSTVIDIENESVVIAPFRKFFNLNEIEENRIENIEKMINKAKIVEFADKLDGSFQCVRFYNGEFILTGSMAIDPEKSWRVKEGYSMLTDNHKRMIKENPHITFMFEFIHPKDAHVVKYTDDKTGLHLIGMRDSVSGYEYYYSEILNIGNKHDVKTVNIENVSLKDVLSMSKTEISSNKEGWVLNVDGYRVKIKCDDYVNLHRLLDKISSINVIIKNVAEGRVDDMLSKIPDAYRGRVERITKVVSDYVVNTELIICKIYDQAPKSSKKEFMMWVDDNVPMKYAGYVKCKFLGKPYNVLKKRGDGYKLAREMGIQDKISEVM